MSNQELIEKAASVLNPHAGPGNRLFGDVGSALVSAEGNVFTGVCIDTPSWGLCAERSAIAAMVTAGEFQVAKVVAVWRDAENRLTVLPPCGVCREFMRNVHEGNLKAEVLISSEATVPLADLLPRHEWPEPLPS